MILITGHVILTPQHRERMIALGAEHSARSRGEAGCLGHHCHIDVENDLRLVFVEEWESVEAARAGDSHLCGGGYDGDADVGAGRMISRKGAKARRRVGDLSRAVFTCWRRRVSHKDTKMAAWSGDTWMPIGRRVPYGRTSSGIESTRRSFDTPTTELETAIFVPLCLCVRNLFSSSRLRAFA